MTRHHLGSRRAWALAATAALTVSAGLASTGSAVAQPTGRHLAHSIDSTNDLTRADGHGAVPRGVTHRAAGAGASSGRLPAGVPEHGRYAFLLQLDTRSTGGAFAAARPRGRLAARVAARSQLGSVVRAQNAVVQALPSRSHVLYRTHAVMAAVAVTTDVRNYPRLQQIRGVSAVYPISPKTVSNSYAVPLQGAPQAWTAYGDLGQQSTVAIIDTGVDYTHADFGGEGTPAAYDAAKAADGKDTADFPGQKVIGGYDFAGDSYNADPASPGYDPQPSPDPWPLDCNGHGSHVAGTVAGYGENADGSTYTGRYDSSTPFDQMRIGPGMAPEAKLYAYRVFGCDGSTDLVSAAIDRAMDPNGDGDTSDHVDVVNMSLGSDFGSPQDGDSMMTQAASAAGITMVVASGNAGDLYDVGGSPGNAPSSIAVAATADAYAQVDALHVSSPGSIAGDYAAERSIAYDWADRPDLQGDVARLTQPGNLDGCEPVDPQYASAIAGKIAFVEWTDNDVTRRCGSAARAQNLVQAGAIGFIYADDQETFSAGITGSDLIPGVLVAKSGGDAIRSELTAGHVVTVSGTTAAGFRQLVPSRNDLLAGFSSRGIGDVGNVKPDLAAVGETVFSAGSGTGNEGLNDSGTSMATPMVAGAAALVTSSHPEWTPEQVKADLMNTAGQDVFTGPDHTGDRYAPQRVGAGRIQVKDALDNRVLAYNADDHGSVSVSFGPREVTHPITLTKRIKVQNTGLGTRTYAVSYQSRTAIPGATWSVSPTSVTLDPRSSQTVTVQLHLDPSQLTKTIDPTVSRQQGYPRQYQADTSGLVELTAPGEPALRVPVYAAPRPASQMSQPGTVTLPGTKRVQSGLLRLSGRQVDQGSGPEHIQSILAGFELQARSGRAPRCTSTVVDHCVDFPDERAADLKYVGATSSAPQARAAGGNPLKDGLTYFAVATQGPWRTAASSQEFDIWIDGNRDGEPDAVLFNTRLPDTDVLVSELYDLTVRNADGSYGAITDVEALNDSLGDTDTAMFDSDVLVLPVATAAIPGVSFRHSRISYGIQSWSPYHAAPLDNVGITDDATLRKPLSLDVLHPGVAVYGSYDGSGSPLLYADSPGSVVEVRRDVRSYVRDGGLGALLLHFHNRLPAKAQVAALKVRPDVTLALSPNPVRHGHRVAATVRVARDAGTPATGRVVIRRAHGRVLAQGRLSDGVATLHFRWASRRDPHLVAAYAGDAHYLSGRSATHRLLSR